MGAPRHSARSLRHSAVNSNLYDVQPQSYAEIAQSDAEGISKLDIRRLSIQLDSVTIFSEPT